jgi:F420H(2)-dependent quinone reductase
MKVGNAFVAAVLRSPFHRLLSGSVDLVRYTGRRSGRTITTPTQYARLGDDIVILVGRPETKTWWRNFREDRDLDVLVRGQWLAMTGRLVDGHRDLDGVAPLVDAYLKRFPRAAKQLGDGSPEERARNAVVVWCRPRACS